LNAVPILTDNEKGLLAIHDKMGFGSFKAGSHEKSHIAPYISRPISLKAKE
jgi:hypothetical protein